MTDMQVPYCNEHNVHKFKNSAEQWRCPVCVMEEYVLEIGEAEEADNETHYCGAELSEGQTCVREVNSPDEVCWQHAEE